MIPQITRLGKKTEKYTFFPFAACRSESRETDSQRWMSLSVCASETSDGIVRAAKGPQRAQREDYG